MYRILMICYGNICRSPMAEFILKDLVKQRGLEHEFQIASRGTSAEELGNPVYPPARAELARHGIDCAGKVSVRLRLEDYEDYDLLLGMDALNMKTIPRMVGGDPDGKVHRLMEHAGGGDVDDPWFTRRFDIAYRDILKGCETWLRRLTKEDASECL